MELLHVEALHPEVVEGFLRLGSNPYGSEHVRKRGLRPILVPEPVFGGDLGGDDGTLVALADNGADQARAMACAVSPGGVDEVATHVQGFVKGQPRIPVVL